MTQWLDISLFWWIIGI